MMVAPRAGAWIETRSEIAVGENIIWSRPARARGLKPCRAPRGRDTVRSRPARARGLKQCPVEAVD